jgi:hypothetical protein
MEQMNELQLQWQERQNTGTTWTHNEEFDKNGYLVSKTYGRLKNYIVLCQKKEDR